MVVKELAKRNVEAAVRRFSDGRLVLMVDPGPDWSSDVLSAGEAIRAGWKPTIEQLYSRVDHRLAEYKGPPGGEPVSMDLVIWNMEHMAQDAFVAEMHRRGVSDAVAERAKHKLALEKWKG